MRIADARTPLEVKERSLLTDLQKIKGEIREHQAFAKTLQTLKKKDQELFTQVKKESQSSRFTDSLLLPNALFFKKKGEALSAALTRTQESKDKLQSLLSQSHRQYGIVQEKNETVRKNTIHQAEEEKSEATQELVGIGARIGDRIPNVGIGPIERRISNEGSMVSSSIEHKSYNPQLTITVKGEHGHETLIHVVQEPQGVIDVSVSSQQRNDQQNESLERRLRWTLIEERKIDARVKVMR